MAYESSYASVQIEHLYFLLFHLYIMSPESKNLQSTLKKLEQIVEELNKKDVDVEEGLKKFREGAELVKFCRSQLARAENEFIKLKADLERDADTGGESADQEDMI